MPMRNVLAMILAGGKGDSLLALSRVRATASVPFAGHYRLIDFALSNCTHSGITNVPRVPQRHVRRRRRLKNFLNKHT